MVWTSGFTVIELLNNLEWYLWNMLSMRLLRPCCLLSRPLLQVAVAICRLLCDNRKVFMWHHPGVLRHGLPWLVQHRWQPRGAGDHCSPTDQWHQRVAALSSGKYLSEYLVYVHIVHSDGTGSCFNRPSSVTIRVCDRHGQPAGDWMISDYFRHPALV